MPELPEVECVRRSLLPVLVGATFERVVVNRAGVVRVCGGGGKDNKADPPRGPLPGREGEAEQGRGDTDIRGALMRGMRVGGIKRHGKQLAIVGEGETGQAGDLSGGGGEGCVVVHLGMSGQLRWSPPEAAQAAPKHTHIVWRTAHGDLRFTDPRRFGGLWCYPSLDAARASRWDQLGPDALGATPARLHAALARTSRALKPALLDQHVVAGLGNIYVDELLFGAKLHPAMPANTVTRAQAASLARRMRTLLHKAIVAGGSTLRDYVDGSGSAGGYQHAHRVYGRAGLACLRRGCGATLVGTTLGGRTTVFCPGCQGSG